MSNKIDRLFRDRNWDELLREVRRTGEYTAFQDAVNQTLTSMNLKVGKRYMFRGIPMHYVGTIARATDKTLILKDAFWLRNTGPYREFLNGNETERNDFVPYENYEVNIKIDNLYDWILWEHF
jgi:hypothetical protein